MKKGNNILLTYVHNNIFVQQDRSILLDNFKVDNYCFRKNANALNLLNALVHQFLYLLSKMRYHNGYYIWFADYHAFMPILFGQILHKPTYLILGGYDLARDRTTKYGVFTGRLRSYMTYYTIRKAKHLITVSEYMARKATYVTGRKDVKVIYNAISLSGNFQNSIKNQTALTVGNIFNATRFKIKGINDFISMAQFLPEYKFVVVGANYHEIEDWYGRRLPDNLEIVKKQPHSALVDYYKGAKLYCQFSRTESFGLSVAEAMFFGCIPLVSKAGGLPEVVGKYGNYTKKSSRDLVETIQRLMQSTDSNQLLEAREYINGKFHFNIRKEMLLKVLTDKD